MHKTSTPRRPNSPAPRARAPQNAPQPHAEQNANADAGHIGRRDPKEIDSLVAPRSDRLPPPTS